MQHNDSIKINKATPVRNFDNELAIFCWPKDGSIHAYPDPAELLKSFLPPWFNYIEEGKIFFAEDTTTKNLSLEEIIIKFTSLGLTVNQDILYINEDAFCDFVQSYNNVTLLKNTKKRI